MASVTLFADSTTITNGATKSAKIDLARFRYGIGLIATVPTGTNADYDVEVTGDPLTVADADKNWNKHDVLVAKTASANSNLAYPVSAVRVYLRSGSVTLTVVTAE